MLDNKHHDNHPIVQESNCHPYVEDFQEHYERIGYMLDPNSPDKMKLNPIYDIPPNDGLKLYAYAS